MESRTLHTLPLSTGCVGWSSLGSPVPRQGGNAASKAVNPTKVCHSSTETLRVRQSMTHELHGEERMRSAAHGTECVKSDSLKKHGSAKIAAGGGR